MSLTSQKMQNWPCSGPQKPEKWTLSKIKYWKISPTIKIHYCKMIVKTIIHFINQNSIWKKLFDMCTINKSEVFWENINVFSVTQTFTQCRDVSHWKGSYQVHIGMALITSQFLKQITKKSKNKRERFSRKPVAVLRPWLELEFGGARSSKLSLSVLFYISYSKEAGGGVLNSPLLLPPPPTSSHPAKEASVVSLLC